jgi:hypothetical protein
MPNFIKVEGKKYPTIILGGDRFLGWFGKPPEHIKDVITTEPYITSIMEKCYQLGVRGFDMSVKKEVINSFKTIKKKHPDAVGIGNPNMDAGYELYGKPLCEFGHRIIATYMNDFFSKELKEKIKNLPLDRKKWFEYPKGTKPLTQKEIDSITIDLDKYQKKLNPLKGVCDFILISECQLDCLSIFDRLDIHEKLIKLVRYNGFIPIGLSELTTISLPKYKKLDYAAYWTWVSKGFQFEDKKAALKEISNAGKPVTSFKSLSGGRLIDDIDGAIKFLKESGLSAVNLGVETEEQAEQTFTVANKYF